MAWWSWICARPNPLCSTATWGGTARPDSGRFIRVRASQIFALLGSAQPGCRIGQGARLCRVLECFFKLFARTRKLFLRHQSLHPFKKLALFFSNVGGKLLREDRQIFDGHFSLLCRRETYAQLDVLSRRFIHQPA